MGELFQRDPAAAGVCASHGSWWRSTAHSPRSGCPRRAAGPGRLSIVGLVIVIRILLIPLFVKQIKASRGMQLIQPEMQEDPGEVQGQDRPGLPAGHDAGDHGAVQADGHQPVRLVPADPAAVADLLRAVPGAERDRRSPTAPGRDRTAEQGARRAGEHVDRASERRCPTRSCDANNLSTQDRHRRPDRADVGHDVHHASVS